MRGRLRSWLKRFPSVSDKQEKIAIFVKRNVTAMILACRFLPGLRVAIPAACAHAEVSPGRFSTFSLLSSAAWAGLILAVVGHYGPASLLYFGVDVRWAPIIPGALILSLFCWAARKEEPLVQKFGSEK
jgi:membrane protein DedA with SNARE-associated domain